MKKRKVLIFLLLLAVSIISYFVYINTKVPYTISEANVEAIYCEYFTNRTSKISVIVSDKKIIISEVSKMRKTSTNGEVGTVSYRFVIELNDGDKFTFIQNTGKVISLYHDKDNFFRKIKAPKTAEFIRRFIDEHDIEL
jgi:Lhr-like helicase